MPAPVIGSILKNAIENRGSVESIYTDVNGIQTDELRKLLRKSKNTEFGKTYQFSDLLKTNDRELIQAFQRRVPVFDYNTMFRSWWHRSLKGEANISWPGKIRYFALSSGTSEASSKYIPVSSDMVKQIRKTSIRQALSLAHYDLPKEFYTKGVLMLGGSTHLDYNGVYYEGDLSGINTGKLPFWFQRFYYPGRKISREKDWNKKLDEIVRKAKDWDIGAIVGVPAWLQILLERIIDHYELNTIHDIWPHLSIFVHGGVAFQPYKNGFEKLLAHPLIYMETYLASEGFIALQTRPNIDSMQLVADNGIFMEFVPFNTDNFDEDGNIKPNPVSIPLHEVEEGEVYGLLLSTTSGAWRYLIGDTVKFTDKKRCEIQITGRTKHFLSLCGEHLSQENMNMAVQLLEEQMDIAIREFSVAGVKHDSMFAHRWFIGTDSPVDPEAVKNQLDENLKALNDDYKTERIAAIKEMTVQILPAAAFYDWMEEKGKTGGQHKFPRVLKEAQLKEWTDFINRYSSL
ncbi:MAG: GH3 auxin-responsive promoter family protein [Bacteroidales bacterium]|nr:GH3 auxin-responsive promoter family protein [Bacteroidales bacterium]MDD3960672.1 GH3 auxin-responsive promoter family protein [Bacteroidales bacterium]